MANVITNRIDAMEVQLGMILSCVKSTPTAVAAPTALEQTGLQSATDMVTARMNAMELQFGTILSCVKNVPAPTAAPNAPVHSFAPAHIPALPHSAATAGEAQASVPPRDGSRIVASSRSSTLPSVLQLGDGTIINYTKEDVPDAPGLGTTYNIKDLHCGWDDRHPDWSGKSYLKLKGHPIAIVYWYNVYRQGKPGQWAAMKSKWHDWKVSAMPLLLFLYTNRYV
jgi:hypothetical protein